MKVKRKGLPDSVSGGGEATDKPQHGYSTEESVNTHSPFGVWLILWIGILSPQRIALVVEYELRDLRRWALDSFSVSCTSNIHVSWKYKVCDLLCWRTCTPFHSRALRIRFGQGFWYVTENGMKSQRVRRCMCTEVTPCLQMCDRLTGSCPV